MPDASIKTQAVRAGRRERRRSQTRERLFRAALGLFAERGFGATTVEDVTEAADVGKGTFFNYFPSKEHVLAAFGEMQLGKVGSAIARWNVEEESVRDVMHRILEALAEEPGRSPELVRALLGANMASAPVRELMLRNLERGRELLAQLLVLGQEVGEVRTDQEAGELARLFEQIYFGTLLMWALDPSPGLGEWLNRTMEVLWTGLGSGRGERRKEARRGERVRKERRP